MCVLCMYMAAEAACGSSWHTFYLRPGVFFLVMVIIRRSEQLLELAAHRAAQRGAERVARERAADETAEQTANNAAEQTADEPSSETANEPSSAAGQTIFRLLNEYSSADGDVTPPASGWEQATDPATGRTFYWLTDDPENTTLTKPDTASSTMIAPRVIAPRVIAPRAPRVIPPRVIAPRVIAPRVIAPTVTAPTVISPRVDATTTAPQTPTPSDSDDDWGPWKGHDMASAPAHPPARPPVCLSVYILCMHITIYVCIPVSLSLSLPIYIYIYVYYI